MKNYYVRLNDLFDNLREAQADDNTVEIEIVKSRIQGMLETAEILGHTIDHSFVEYWQEVA